MRERCRGTLHSQSIMSLYNGTMDVVLCSEMMKSVMPVSMYVSQNTDIH